MGGSLWPSPAQVSSVPPSLLAPVARALAPWATRPGWRTRFAPAPTGWLHLGHAVNAVWVWSIARAFGGQLLLRIEDHDRLRCRPEYEAGILDDLDWLGLEPDLGTTASYRAIGPHPFRQHDRATVYASALGELESRGLAYPCRCSRKDIARAMASTAEPGETAFEELRYPGTCREAGVQAAETLARRVVMAPGDEPIHELRCPAAAQQPAAQCGDVLVRDRHGSFTYQWCVVVDDAAQAIDLVIRGEDLLASTGRQRRLAQLLGVASPDTLHHPLVRHPDGAKLSKSNRDTGLRELRAQGMSPGEVLGLAAQLGGLADTAEPRAAHELAALWA
jgi:glutamyl/glutaminyl-tRNA synthetase